MTDPQKTSFQEKNTAYEIERDIFIHFKYETYNYPEGDIKYSLIMNLPIPEMPGENIHIDNDYESFQTLMEHALQDLQDYLDDPHEYCANVLRNGSDDARKLKQIEIDLRQEEKNLEWNQYRLSESHKRIMKLREDIDKLGGSNAK